MHTFGLGKQRPARVNHSPERPFERQLPFKVRSPGTTGGSDPHDTQLLGHVGFSCVQGEAVTLNTTQRIARTLFCQTRAFLRRAGDIYLEAWAHTFWAGITHSYLDIYWSGRSISSICSHQDADEIEMWRRESINCKRRIFNQINQVIAVFHGLCVLTALYGFYLHVWYTTMFGMVNNAITTAVARRL